MLKRAKKLLLNDQAGRLREPMAKLKAGKSFINLFNLYLYLELYGWESNKLSLFCIIFSSSLIEENNIIIKYHICWNKHPGHLFSFGTLRVGACLNKYSNL